MKTFKQYIEEFDALDIDESIIVENVVTDKIIKELGAKSMKDIKLDDIRKLGSADTVFVQSGGKDYNVITHFKSLTVWDITNGLLTGKTVDGVRFTSQSGYVDDIIPVYLKSLGYKSIFDALNLKTGNVDVVMDDGKVEKLEIYKMTKKSKNYFSPFNIAKLGRLASIPSKWKVLDVVKVIMNGQYKRLSRDGRYTDDHAYDNSTNFGKVDNLAPLPVVIKLLELGSNVPYTQQKGDDIIIHFGRSYEDFSLVLDLKGKHKI